MLVEDLHLLLINVTPFRPPTPSVAHLAQKTNRLSKVHRDPKNGTKINAALIITRLSKVVNVTNRVHTLINSFNYWSQSLDMATPECHSVHY